MKNLLILLVSTILSIFPSHGSVDDNREFESLLSSSREHLNYQEFDLAYDDIFAAMKIAEDSKSDVWRAECLCNVATIDIAASRDAHAWEMASEAENLSRDKGFKKWLAMSLIVKAQVCMYAQVVSDEPSRDDEGLSYLEEAIPLCESKDMQRYLVEALGSQCQLYVNKNRWNKNLDMEIYEKAGESLDRAEFVSSAINDNHIFRKLFMIKMRYLRQGGKYYQALDYCTEALSRCSESDNLSRYQIYDQMTNLYSMMDSTEQAVASHQNTIQAISLYMRQKSDDKLRNIEAAHEAERQEHQIHILWSRLYALVITLLLAAIILLGLLRRVRKTRTTNENLSATNEKLSKDNEVKEQVISFISPDITSPDKERSGALTELSEQCLFLENEQQIREHCSKVLAEYNMSPEVATYISESIVSRRKRAEMHGISPREIQVIQLCRQGMTSAEIAAKLFISVNTVSTHKRNIYSKLEVGNTAEMIKKSLSLGLL